MLAAFAAAVLGSAPPLVEVQAARSHRRIYAAGSGHDMLGLAETTAEIVALSNQTHPRVLYLGTATYDEPSAMDDQTKGFAARGCPVASLSIAWRAPPHSELAAAFDSADIVVISGGNTLFAVDRWVRLGVDALMRTANARGVVLAGGSAGFISLCNGGHSDSMEPDSYKNPPGPLLNSSAAAKAAVDAAWAYVRVPGIGVLDSLCCPHFDMTGTNGVHRAVDFSTIQGARHLGEFAIGIDNCARPGACKPKEPLAPSRPGTCPP